MSDQVHPGELIRLTATFRNPAGQLADPTNVRLRVKAGSLPEEVVEETADSTGMFHADYTVPFAGPAFRLRYRWEGTGAVTAVLEGEVEVRSQWPELP